MSSKTVEIITLKKDMEPLITLAVNGGCPRRSIGRLLQKYHHGFSAPAAPIGLFGPASLDTLTPITNFGTYL
jgi:hypothetical protein